MRHLRLTLALVLCLPCNGQLVCPPLGLDAYLPAPEDNPFTREKIELGKKLFSDKRLSRDGTVSCATCHDPHYSFADSRTVAVGIRGQKSTRHAPTLINRVFGKSFFWDGRAATLEQQVLQPIANALEMNMPLEELPQHVQWNATDVSRALAAYVRTILAGNSPYDRYLSGDRSALSTEEQEGLRLFRGKANCATCHVGANLTDERFHNTGIAWENGFRDDGRFAVTQREADRGAFKTPTLREAARRAPFMHDGSLTTIEEVIEFYDHGGKANLNLDPEIHPLHLTPEEKNRLAAFLRALTGVVQDGVAPGIFR